MLDKKGLALAAMIGILMIIIGVEYFILMIVFLAISIMATKYQYFPKKEMGIYEHERSWENVLSNGFGPLIFALSSYWFGPIPYICSVSAVMSDKFASELGVLAGEPVSLKDFKKVRPGTSGAVSSFGTLMSLGGAILIGIAGIGLFGITPTQALIIGILGFLGSVIDSMFGVFEEMGIGTKGTTNFICSASAGIIGILLILWGIL
ncbi:MAG: DUF92 domain-containing protein [Candidatus ainarchaeum sp.]|nr:DUF92 domain-containing protein [Candidatus ainarchaeum sp.]